MSNNETIVCDTADSIAHFRLASLKGQLKMEKHGMKGSMSPLRPKLAAEFGLKPRDSHDKFIAVIQAKMDAFVTKAAAESAVDQTVQ